MSLTDWVFLFKNNAPKKISFSSMGGETSSISPFDMQQLYNLRGHTSVADFVLSGLLYYTTEKRKKERKVHMVYSIGLISTFLYSFFIFFRT